MDQDWLWLEHFEKGDHTSFKHIFDKHKAGVINLAFRFVGARESAEDIAQEVFIKIYEKRVHFDPKAKFSTWLYRVTVNAALDVLRKKKFVGASLDEEVSDREGEKKTFLESLSDPRSASPSEVLIMEELQVLVQNEVNRLPEKFKVPILLHQFQGMPYGDIANLLGITKKAVEKRIYHGKELLRKKLSRYF